jgi:hypothetical protein
MVVMLSFIATLFWCSLWCYNYLPLPHSPNHLPQINKHQLSILVNVDEVVFSRSRSFQLCSLEITGPTHSECSAFFVIHGSSSSCCWLPNLMFCLTHTWASSSFHIQFLYYATSWLLSRPSTRWWVGNSLYAKS